MKYFELGAQMEKQRHAGSSRTELTTGEDTGAKEIRDKLKLPVSVLEPSVRAENCLAAANIQTLGDLVKLTEGDVLKIKNFGKTSLKEIKKKLFDMGLTFGMEVGEEAGAPTAQG